MKCVYLLLLLGWMATTVCAQNLGMTADSLTHTALADSTKTELDSITDNVETHYGLIVGYDYYQWKTKGKNVSTPANLRGFHVGWMVDFYNKDDLGSRVQGRCAPTLAFAFNRTTQPTTHITTKTYYLSLQLPSSVGYRIPLQHGEIVPYAGFDIKFNLTGWEKEIDANGNYLHKVKWFKKIETEDDDDDDPWWMDIFSSRATRIGGRTPTDTPTQEEEDKEDDYLSCRDGRVLTLGGQIGVNYRIGNVCIGYMLERDWVHIWHGAGMRMHSLSLGVYLK